MAQIIIHTYFVIVGSCYFVASHSKCNTIKQIEIAIYDTRDLRRVSGTQPCQLCNHNESVLSLSCIGCSNVLLA